MNNVCYKFPDGRLLLVHDTDAVPRRGQEVRVIGRDAIPDVWEVERVYFELTTVIGTTVIQTAVVEVGPA